MSVTAELQTYTASLNITRMSIREKLKHELKAVILVTLFFAAWLGVFMAIKILILELMI